FLEENVGLEIRRASTRELGSDDLSEGSDAQASSTGDRRSPSSRRSLAHSSSLTGVQAAVAIAKPTSSPAPRRRAVALSASPEEFIMYVLALRCFLLPLSPALAGDGQADGADGAAGRGPPPGGSQQTGAGGGASVDAAVDERHIISRITLGLVEHL